MQMCPQDSARSAAAAFFVCAFNLADPKELSRAWQYVAGLYREGKEEMGNYADDALHLLMHDRESMEVQTECAWPGWQEAAASHNPYPANPEWPVTLQHDRADPIDFCSSEGSSVDYAITPDGPLPDLVLRWTPCPEADLAATKPIVEGRLGRFGAYQSAYQTEGAEIMMSVWYEEPHRVEEAQLCLHGRIILDEVRLFVTLGDDFPEDETTIEVNYQRKENKDGTLSGDARSLGFLYDTFSRCVGNVKHIALSGEGLATIQFFNEESATASLAPKALPKPYPKWVLTLSRIEDTQDHYLALRRSLLATPPSSVGTVSPPSSVGPPSPDQAPHSCPCPRLPSMVPESECRWPAMSSTCY